MLLFCVSVAFVLCLLYIINALRIFFFFASGIMLMLICLKDLFWAATGRVSAVSLSVLHHLRLWKGGSGFACDLLSCDDRSEQGSQRQNLRVRLEVGLLLEERYISWCILADCSCFISKNLLECVFKMLFKISSYFQNL